MKNDYICSVLSKETQDILDKTKRYAQLAKGNVRNFQERTARTVYGSRYIAWAGYSFSVQVILTTSF